MRIDLNARRALVIGGGGDGIGRAICRGFAACGAHVVVADRDLDTAQACANHIVAQNGSAEALALDATNMADASAAIAALTAAQPVDILHYNVGIGFATETLSLEAEQFAAVLDANLIGLHNAVRAVIPSMRQQRRGIILATSSAWAHRHLGYTHSFYAASKAGMEHFIRVIAQEYAGDGIRANAIAPGFIDTPRVHRTLAHAYGDGNFDAALARRAAQVPLGRLGQPQDVAHMAVFLASDLAAYVTGGTFLVDGGLAGARIAG